MVNLQALEYTESTDAKVGSKNGEISVEKLYGPPEFGEDEEYTFEEDQQAVDDCPEYACCLIGYGASAMK